MRAQSLATLIGVAIVIFVVIVLGSTGSYVVDPGFRGVEVTLGKVSPVFKPVLCRRPNFGVGESLPPSSDN
jgi:prohibitin 2